MGACIKQGIQEQCKFVLTEGSLLADATVESPSAPSKQHRR